MSAIPAITLIDVGNEVPFFDGPSLGVLALQNYLDQCGVKSAILPACGTGISDRPRSDAIEQFLSRHQGSFGEVLGFSCTSDDLPQALFLAQAAKRLSGAFILLGGVGPTLLAEEIVAAYPFVDAVCVGEGEETLLQISAVGRDPEALSGVRGIVFPSPNGKVVRTGSRPRIGDLDCLPVTHAVMELEDDPLGYDFMVHLIASRGCPGTCSFCSHRSVWGNHRATLSMDRLCEFLQTNEYGGDRMLVVLHDDTFIFPGSRLLDLEQEIGRRGMSIRWSCFARVADISENTGSVLRATGCDEVTLGVDGVSTDILAGMRKATGLAEGKRAVATLLDAGVAVRVNLIWDWPGETYEDFENMVHFAYESLCLGALVGMSRLIVYPKTRLSFALGTRMIVDDASIRNLDCILGDAAVFVRENPTMFLNFFRHSHSRETEKKIALFEKVAFMFGSDLTRQTRHPVRWTDRREYGS